MADMDAEAAFLKSMQAMSDATGGYGADDVVEPVHQEPLSTEDNDHLQDVQDSTAAPSTLPADPVSGDPNASPVQSPTATSSSDTVHPTSMSHQSPTSVSNATAMDLPSIPNTIETESSKRGPSTPTPRTRGGFIEDDEEDDEGTTLNVPGIANVSPSRPDSSLREGVSTEAQPEFSRSPLNVPAASREASAPATSLNDGANVAQEGIANTLSGATQEDAGQLNKAQDAALSHQASAVGTPTTTAPKARLPYDKIGMLEDRIKEDPRGDIDAWLTLISEHRRRNKLEDARTTYERFLKIFPTAAEQWVAYANMELANNDFYRVEQIFTKSLRNLPSLQLWSLYLDYVRRRNNLTGDTSGAARTVITQTYDFVLQNIGIDKESGQIWRDYIQFIRSGPGIIGGSGWQDQQKMDLLRKAYQRAICVPTSAVNQLWKEYDGFEMGLNKTTGRKFLHEKSPGYMTARSSYIGLDNIIRDLDRTTSPRMPPAVGFDGDEQYTRQVDIWGRWIQWEKEDPLVLRGEDPAGYKARIVFTYKQAVMALRFWPEMWYDAAEFCYQNDLDKEGDEFLAQGLTANPESCLLAFAQADRLEYTLPSEEGPEGLKRRGDAVRKPYDKVLDALYDLVAKARARETQNIALIEESFAQGQLSGLGGDEDEQDEERAAQEAAKASQIKLVKDGNAAHLQMLSRTISFAWIALMRAMRRVQGKGKVGDMVGGCRQIFTDARKRGRLTSDVYVASALIEYQCYKDPAATKIFERGLRLFPEDERFALEYLKHLTAINDVTNARAVFETTVSKLTAKPESVHKAKPIFQFFHQFEAHYGELAQIRKLEKRMKDLFPDDAQLSRFAQRFKAPEFDPMAVRPIISPATQLRPKGQHPVDAVPSTQNTPPQRPAPTVGSPKRPLPVEDSDNELNRPRKLMRGESPLKGAAGRRLDQQKRNQQQHHQHQHGPSFGGGQSASMSGSWGSQPPPPPPPPLPRDVLFLLSIIPKAETYHASRFSPEAMVRLLRDTNIPNHSMSKPSSARPMSQAFVQSQPNGPFRYVR